MALYTSLPMAYPYGTNEIQYDVKNIVIDPTQLHYKLHDASPNKLVVASMAVAEPNSFPDYRIVFAMDRNTQNHLSLYVSKVFYYYYLCYSLCHVVKLSWVVSLHCDNP